MIVVADTSPLNYWCSSDISKSWRKSTLRFLYRKPSLMSFRVATLPQSSFAIGVDRTRISCGCSWNYRTACGLPRRKPHIIVLGQCRARRKSGSGRPFRGFLPRKTTPRKFFQATVIANLPISIHVRSSSPGTDVLGHSQSSLRGWSRWECRPSTAPDFLHAALDRSAYAAFFTESRTRLFGSTKLHRKSGYVLGYSQPSLRDCSRYTLIAAWSSSSAVQIAGSKRPIWTSLTLAFPAGPSLSVEFSRGTFGPRKECRTEVTLVKSYLSDQAKAFCFGVSSVVLQLSFYICRDGTGCPTSLRA